MAGGIADILIRTSPRAIGQIYADVTVEENHRDEVIITQHPVENGGIITDHAFKRPSELEIRCGFSDSTAGYDGYVQEQYRALLALQLARQPFDVYTGKRAYRNMLIRGLSVVTDPHSEFVLMASVALQEVTLVSTQTTGGGSSADTAAPNADPSQQADPASTGAVTNGGSVETQGVGTQAFAGAYNAGTASPVGPGAYNIDGTPATGQGFGLNTPGADLTPQTPQLSGISPPTSITLPEISVTAPESVGGLQGAGPDQYNMFGGGP